MSIVTIILARGGSKGLPRKNIKPLCGLPLIAHTVLDAVEAQLVNQIYVSTDDPEIASVSKAYRATIIHRPSVFATDCASSESALMHALQSIEKKEVCTELIVFLQCTSPIRSGQDIDRAIRKLLTEDADSLVSVSPSHRFLWEEVNGEAKPINYEYSRRPRRQDMSPQYVENGSIYIFKPWVLKELGNRLGGKIALFKMSEAAAHEIDTPLDFEIAEFLLKHQVASHAD